MGSGEYGGNGSVHWKVTNRRDRNNGGGASAHTYTEVDEQPAAAQGGFFVIQVLDVSLADVRYNPGPPDAQGVVRGKLTVRVPIKHGDDYTRQVRVTWPPDEIAWPQDGQEVQAVGQGA